MGAAIARLETKFALFVRLLMAGAIAGSAFAAEADLRAQFEARYATMKAAMAARDPDAIAALLTPDFVSVDASNRSEDGAAMIRDVVALPVDPNKDSHTTLATISRNADTVVVEQRYVMTTRKIGPDGKMHDIRLTALSTDTWVSSDKGWRLQRTVTNQMDYAIDGETMVHKVRPK